MSTGATTVALPDGCYGVQMASDGAEFNSKSGTVEIPDAYMPEFSASNAVRNGIMSTGRSYRLGTKRGRVCRTCNFRAQVWSRTCPRGCGPTREE
jgi:hypothetical protein